MCGIVGYTGFRDAYDVVINGLRRLEYRGYDSAGVILELQNGDFEFKKVALHTLETNYILLALVVLIVLGITLCSASSYINIVEIVENLVELILGFFIALTMSLLGPWYNTIGNEYGAYVIPFFILVILSIPTLFFINYKFVYKDFEVPKNKKMKLSFLTALANAPYELLIPYGQFGAMIFKSTIL